MSRAVALVLGVVSACSPPAPASPPANTTPRPAPLTSHVEVPSVAVITAAEWEACEAQDPPVLDNGIDRDFYCEGQVLEGGAPLRYRHLPAVSDDGNALAVVEERDGWGHVKPGVRIIDATGMTISFWPLSGTGADVEAAVAKANAELARRRWIPLQPPETTQRPLDDDRAQITFALGSYTVAYDKPDDGGMSPPTRIVVRDAKGAEVLARTDTARAWSAKPRCNAPKFELVGATPSPGTVLFKTGLGMGGHDCDGVEQPPAWHVLRFPSR